MRLLIYADLQGTDGDAVSFLEPGKPLQHCRMEQFFKDMLRIYHEHECCGVIDLGDTTDDRTSITWPTIEILGTGLNLLPDSDWNFKLTGNHEQYLRSAEINNRRLFEHKFSVVDGCEIFEFGDYMAFFCSFSEDYGELTKWIVEGVKEYRDRPKILFGHFQVLGARMNSGSALHGVPVDVLKHFNIVLLGHVHLPQTIDKCIHYIGSPFQQNWGEAGENKRVGVLDTDDCSITWVPLEGYPEYRQVTLEQFKVVSQQKTENRFKVTLTSHAEAEVFFRHPLFQQAEPVYVYEEGLPEEQKVEEDWTFEGIAKRYMALVPPSAAGIESGDAEVLEIGKMISTGDI